MELQESAETKKERIMRASKILFYEKGYKDTTYEDICEAAQVTLGTVTYHLSGKRNIAGMIMEEFENEHKLILDTLTGGRYDLRTMTALRILRWWERMKLDQNIRRFLTELITEGILRTALGGYFEHLFQMLILEYDLYISDRRLKLIATAHIGLTDELLLSLSDGEGTGNIMEIADFIIESLFKALDTDYITIRELIKRTHEIYDTIENDNEYFAYFRYGKNN